MNRRIRANTHYAANPETRGKVDIYYYRDTRRNHDYGQRQLKSNSVPFRAEEGIPLFEEKAILSGIFGFYILLNMKTSRGN